MNKEMEIYSNSAKDADERLARMERKRLEGENIRTEIKQSHAQYVKPVMGPSKNGSKYCANTEGGRNGSIASGGTVEYCTCDSCF